MKIKRSFFKKKITATVVIVLVIASTAVGYLLWRNTQQPSPVSSENTPENILKKKINYDPPTEAEIKAGVEAKKSAQSQTDNRVPSASSYTTTITSKNQNGNLLQIRTLINTLVSTGTCTLTLTQGTTVITKTAGIQALANDSTCKGFDVATTELAPGKWSVSINVNIGSANSNVTDTVTIS